jgi:hypothetical protein
MIARTITRARDRAHARTGVRQRDQRESVMSAVVAVIALVQVLQSYAPAQRGGAHDLRPAPC